MKTAAMPSVVYPSESVLVGKGMLCLLAVLWILLLVLTTAEPGTPATVGLGMLLACACGALITVGTYHADVLGNAWRVIRTHRAPDALWQAWARSTLVSVTIPWAVVCVGMAAQFLMPASSTPWLTAPALLSPLLCVSMLRMLASKGLIERGWAWAMDGCLAALVLFAFVGPSFRVLERWFTGLPAPLLLACALSWPALAWLLDRRWRQAMPSLCTARGNAVAPTRKVMSHFKRYTVLRWNKTPPDQQSWPLSAMSTVSRWLSVEMAFYFVLLRMVPLEWGGSVTPMRALGLYLICTLTMSRLLVRDRQWRSLLLPGGLRRERLGEHIIRSTFTIHMFGLLGMVLAFATGELLVGLPLADLPGKLSGTVILPFELLFITCAATALRASASRAFVNAAGAAAIVAGVAYLYFARHLDGAFNWTIGLPYMTILLIASGLLMLVANHRWTVEKLFREIH